MPSPREAAAVGIRRPSTVSSSGKAGAASWFWAWATPELAASSAQAIQLRIVPTPISPWLLRTSRAVAATIPNVAGHVKII